MNFLQKRGVQPLTQGKFVWEVISKGGGGGGGVRTPWTPHPPPMDLPLGGLCLALSISAGFGLGVSGGGRLGLSVHLECLFVPGGLSISTGIGTFCGLSHGPGQLSTSRSCQCFRYRSAQTSLGDHFVGSEGGRSIKRKLGTTVIITSARTISPTVTDVKGKETHVLRVPPITDPNASLYNIGTGCHHAWIKLQMNPVQAPWL